MLHAKQTVLLLYSESTVLKQ